MGKMRRTISCLLMLFLVIMAAIGHRPTAVQAADPYVTGNNTMSTAYECGLWSSMSLSGVYTTLVEGEQQSWFKVSVAPGERIYVNVNSNPDYAGMSVQLKNGLGIDEGNPKQNPRDLVYYQGVNNGLYLNIDNNSTSTRSYYLVVDRGDLNEGNLYFNVKSGNRIRTGSGIFSFSGTATNPGNGKPPSLTGVDSTVLALDLRNSTAIPQKAVVTKVDTSGSQSPSQGNVRHMINSGATSIWYTSTVSSATSGHYDIDIDDSYDTHQIWKFKYNAMAGAKSTMSNVKITLKYEYDMKYTSYRIFLN